MLIACDFDGTISNIDTTDLILSKLALPEWEATEEEWLAGKIGSRECMQRQVGLIEANKEKLDQLIDSVEIEPYFKDLVKTCRKLDIPLVILSDGIDYVIHRILAKNNIYGIKTFANRLVAKGEQNYSLAFPNSAAGCNAGTCKCRQVSAEKILTIYVGDGRSDFCVSGKVDLVVAKTSLLEYCRQNNLSHIPFQDFGKVAELVERLHPHCYDDSSKTYIKPQLNLTLENTIHI